MFTKHDSIPYASVLPGIERRTLCHGARMLMTEFRLRAGSELPAHAHPHEQTGYLVCGRLRLRIGTEARELAPGDSWSIPGGVEHQATILEDSVALEVFSPVREDYLPSGGAWHGVPAMDQGEEIPGGQIGRATVADAAEIHALQRLAYRSEAELYHDWTIPPLTEPLAATEGALAVQLVLKAVVDGRITGAVRGRLAGDGTCHIGRLIVHPEAQGRGLGTRLMRALEAALPEARRFELFTGEKSARNLHLYAKLGYRAFRSAPLSPQVMLVYLEKRRG